MRNAATPKPAGKESSVAMTEKSIESNLKPSVKGGSRFECSNAALRSRREMGRDWKEILRAICRKTGLVKHEVCYHKINQKYFEQI